MKIKKIKQLEELLCKILMAAGTPMDIAEYVSASLTDSSLKGVDSHGVFRISQLIDQIEEGYLKPSARPEIVKDTATTAIIRGHFGFGMYALGYAVDLAVQKAKASNVAAVGLYENTWTGRLGRFVELAAEENVIAVLTGGGANRHDRHKSVTPYGGTKRMMATNPYAIGIPGGRFGTVVVDIATSITSVGKVSYYRSAKQPLPTGFILNKDGRPSTDPEDFFAGGVILPAAGHKGYGLALVAELLTDALLGNPFELNWFITVIDIEAFRPVPEFVQTTEDILQRIKEIPPAVGFDEVLIPGEPEARAARSRSIEGISIPDEIWLKIQETAHKVGVLSDDLNEIKLDLR
jgi:LDH2 family malate/lactate/ureidoglycolate dehydrogenase